MNRSPRLCASSRRPAVLLIELVQHTAPLRPGHAGIDPGERALTVSHHHAAAAPAGLRVTPARSAP